MNFPSPTRCFTNETNNMSLKSKNSKFNFGKQKYRKKSKCTYRRCLVSFEAFYEQWFLHLDSRGSCELGKKPFSYYRWKIAIRADNYAFQPKLQFFWRTTKSQLLWTAIGIIHLKRDVTISTKKHIPQVWCSIPTTTSMGDALKAKCQKTFGCLIPNIRTLG